MRILSFLKFLNSDAKWRNESQKTLLEATHRPQDQRWVKIPMNDFCYPLKYKIFFNFSYLKYTKYFKFWIYVTSRIKVVA